MAKIEQTNWLSGHAVDHPRVVDVVVVAGDGDGAGAENNVHAHLYSDIPQHLTGVKNLFTIFFATQMMIYENLGSWWKEILVLRFAM